MLIANLHKRLWEESIMNKGKAFELLVKYILMSVGFSEVNSDGIYIFDGPPGQMIQGLGESHNADVLLEPPVQIPFYSMSRLLVECKCYKQKVGLNTVRAVLGLREDINHFDIVDLNELQVRRQQNRSKNIYNYDRYYYQVAIASTNGFSIQAQNFAATYRIPLIEFNKMPFWKEYINAFNYTDGFCHEPNVVPNEETIIRQAVEIGQRMAVAITNLGQILFLYNQGNRSIDFDDNYTLHWHHPKEPWELRTGHNTYLFQLPKDILKVWLNKSVTELDMKRSAINCKATFLSNMVVYYSDKYRQSKIKMISIDITQLNEARKAVE